MREKHGVTAVIFDERGGMRYFLVLHRVLNWKGWEFCKGGIDVGEMPEQAVLREVDEETGLRNVSIVSSLPRKVSWTHKGMKYVYTPFIIRGDMSEKLDLLQQIVEHDDYRWLEEERVEGFLTHGDNKKIFREALAVLAGHGMNA
ncbi:MAG: NUDIX hydrolase [Candidatus Diapherotrites archaeon]|uniref:NUDIX hydrolase n=1 Tax=Candidatus Iainarchaeum sp. TaxID=3101447 RepID=A0A8T3YLM6_9ARCH|nr:NUDIX hydrolase [Candidatus Diapherotrites archaeon]